MGGGKSSSDGRLEVWMNRKIIRQFNCSCHDDTVCSDQGLPNSCDGSLLIVTCEEQKSRSQGLSFLFQWNMAPRRDLEETFKRLDEDRSGQACDRPPWLSRDNPSTDQSSGSANPLQVPKSLNRSRNG